MNSIVEQLLEKQEQLKFEVKAIEEAVTTIRMHCKHYWVEAGSGHNDTMYECNICGSVKFE